MTKTNAVTRRDLKQIAFEKTALLRSALEQMDGEFRLEEVGKDLIAHVLCEEKLDPTSLSHQAKAMAFVLCRLNLALDRATEGSVTKAVVALSRVQENTVLLIRLYGMALKLEQAVQVDLSLDDMVVGVKRSHDSVDYYGLLDPAEEVSILRWKKEGLRDRHGLPPASLKELEEMKARIEMAKTLSLLGKKIVWRKILEDIWVSKFISIFFRRAGKSKPGNGGIVGPFITSLMARALLKDSWLRRLPDRMGYKVEDTEYIFLDQTLLTEFLELLMFNQEILFEQGEEAVKRITEFFGMKRSFFEEMEKQEIDFFLAQLEPALQKFAREARAFYMKVISVEAPTPREIDQFWRSRLFLYSHEDVDVRIAREDLATKPVWKEALSATSLEQLLGHLAVFHEWPEAERNKFVETVNFDLLLSRESKQDAETRGRVLRLRDLTKGGVGRENYWRFIRDRIDWSQRADLVLEIGWSFSSDFENDFFVLLYRVKNWKHCHLENLPACGGRTGEILEIILAKVGPGLSQGVWKEVVKNFASNGSRPFVSPVWKHLPDQYRAACFYEFSAMLLSYFVYEMEPDEVRRKIIPVLNTLAKRKNFLKEFPDWARPYRGHERFVIRGGSPGMSVFLTHLESLGVKI